MLAQCTVRYEVASQIQVGGHEQIVGGRLKCHVPFGCGTMVNCSHVLATGRWRSVGPCWELGDLCRGAKLPLIVDRSEIVPFALLIIWYCSHVEATDAVAVRTMCPQRLQSRSCC